MNIQRSKILDHNAREVTKNICCAKDDVTVDPSSVTTRWFLKYLARTAKTSTISQGQA